MAEQILTSVTCTQWQIKFTNEVYTNTLSLEFW